MDPMAKVAAAQGLYFTATGLWPLLHMESFEAVTGRKRDRWLVRTVGALVTAIGATLLVSAARRRPPAEIALLATGSSMALAAVEAIHVGRGRIAPIYLADALLEAAMVATWIAGRRRSRRLRAACAPGARALRDLLH